MNENLKLQQQYEGSRLLAAAYAAKDIKSLLATNPSQQELAVGLHNALVKVGFNADQSESFVNKYTPAAALDQDGAGALLFKVNGTDQIAFGVRGTNPENPSPDLIADGAIFLGELPVYQTTLIANFLLRETTPLGQYAPQFGVQGGNSNVSDLARALMDTLANAGGEKGSTSNLVTMPVIIQTGSVMGTGRAVGLCADAVAHSEGAPEITTLGTAIAQCARITTVNGPGASLEQMQSVVDQILTSLNRPLQDISSQNQLNIHTTGVSVTDGLNNGLTGEQTLLNIPTVFGGMVGSHSSIDAMNAAEAAYFRGDLSQRISPVGTVVMNPSHTLDYNFTDTAGAGRGFVNPDAVQPSISIFNPVTALLSYGGDNAITVKSGDTVSSIARRYDMSVDEFSGFLKMQYGEGADLNSILAGSKLPIPLDVYERTLAGVNPLGFLLDHATPTSTSDASKQVKDAFSNADQIAADIKAKYPDTLQVADASDCLSSGSPKTATESGIDLNKNQAQGGVSMFNAAIAASQHWGQMDDVHRAAVLGQMYMASNQISGGATSLGDSTSAALSGLNFINALEHGQTLQALQSGLQLGQVGQSIYSHSMTGAANDMMSAAAVTAADSAAYVATAESAAASNAMDEAVPYVNYTIALKNFVDNPEKAAVTMVSTYAGETIGAAFGGSVGAVIGGAIGGMIGGSIDNTLGFGDDDAPAPEGRVQFGWDVNGQIEHHVIYERSGGGAAATSVASSIQNMLQSIVDAHNAQNTSTADDIAINPYCLPAVHFKADWGGATVEIAAQDGHLATQNLNDPNFGQWLVQTMLDNGGIAPAWQVQTVAAHVHAQRAAGVDEEAIAAEAGITATVGAHEGDAAYSVQGAAAELADFKSQTFGTLVVHLGDDPNAQAAQTQLTQVLRDVEGDGYFEKTQTVAAKDSAGNLQAVLTIDFNGDGMVQTRDILNLGGNTGEGLSAGGQLANAHADQQRNNVQWLDANGDGVLDKSDPAFAAIKLWVDVNQDGSQQASEAASLSSQQISSINFKTGEVTYDDGHTDALTGQTLKADTEGVKLTQMMHTDAQGNSVALDAGTFLEHEGYKGQELVTDITGAHWQQVRAQTYEQQALRTGDWEGTAEQDAHRHGGGNVQGAPTETTATGATDLGAVQAQANIITQSTLEEDDARVVSNALTPAPQPKANAKTTLGAGDSRITSNAPANNNATNNTNSAVATNARIAFVPTAQTSVQSEIQFFTANMIESSQNLLVGGGSVSLGVLTAIGTGATASAAMASEVVQRPVVASEVRSTEASTEAPVVINPISSINTFSSTLSTTSNSVEITPIVVFKQVDLGVLYVPAVVSNATPVAEAQNTVSTNLASTNLAPPATFVQATVMINASVVPLVSTTANKTSVSTPLAAALTLDYPMVQGETLAGTEDVVLRLPQSVLLANDSTPNASADPTQAALTITAVSTPTHGQVSLVAGEVVFLPDVDFHGEASFTYTVTDQYGLSTTGIATLNIAAVNDAPVTTGEAATGNEDTGLIFTQAQLLANDSDVDVATDRQVLSISRVGQAQHGKAWLDEQGQVRFVPDANYHGPAHFTYWVSDGTGEETSAAVSLTVNAVNDMPVAVGETISEKEDTKLLISQAALLQNDSDVDTATDGQVLSITAVNNAHHGTVTLNADGTISFVPEANFYGNASFDYTVDDGNGGQTTTTATIALANVDDAPVATGETINSKEDEVLTINASTLLQNDTDIDNAYADLSISRVASGTGGSVSLNASGNVVFTPTANYNGTATFTYWVKDPDGLESNAVTTKVVLAAVNDAPSAQGETVTGASEDAVFNINKSTLLANDHDIDNADSELSLSWVGNATGGTVSLGADGNVVFTPTANFNGNASFEYKVRDPDGLESPVVQAVIPVAAVNDAPVAVDDQFVTYENTTMTIGFDQLIGNDSDVDGDALTVSAVRDHANGHASIVNGQVEFVANAGFTRAASFDYLADDRHGGQTWATAEVTVNIPPNQYPTVVLTGTNFMGTGSPGIDIATASWYLSDDTGIQSFNLQSYQVYEKSGRGSWHWGDLNGVLTIFDNGVDGMHWDWRRTTGISQLESTWVVTDTQGLSNVWHFNYDISLGVTANYMEHTGAYYAPIILDLNSDGTHYTSLVDSKVAFDVNFDGIQDKIAWAGNNDGVLVWDKDHNHQITDASEFGFQSLKAGAQTDLEGLQALDTNSNGLLDAADEKFAEFAVWQDVNGNGVTDEGEFKTLAQLGIASINLHSNGQVHSVGAPLVNSGSGETDVTVMGTTVFTRTDGSIGHADDAMLAYEDGATQQKAEINRQALLFNQMCNMAFVHDTQLLGVVPIEPDVSLHDLVAQSSSASNTLLSTSSTLHNT